MAVFVLSQSVSKKAIEAIAKAVNAEVKPDSDVKQLTQAVVAQIDRLQKSASAADQSPVVKPPPVAEAATQPESSRPTTMRINGSQGQPSQTAIDVPSDAPRLTVSFVERSFKVEADQAQSIAGFIGENQVATGHPTIVVNAYAYSGEGAISEARRLAYYRGMMARKQLVDIKVKPENIRISVNDTTDKSRGMTVELIVAGSAH